MQENTNLNQNTEETNQVQNNQAQTINVLENTIPQTPNKSESVPRFIKIILSVFVFIFLIAGTAYYFYSKKPTNVVSGGRPSFPDLNTGRDLPGQIYENKDENKIPTNSSAEFDEDESTGLVNIWPKEISGYGFVSKPLGTTAEKYVMFTDTETGNVYKHDILSGKNERLTNTLLSNIFDSAFSVTGEYILVLQKNGSKYFDLIGSRLSLDETDSAFSVTEIDTAVFGLLASRAENVFYYLKNLNGSSVLNSYSPKTGKVTEVTKLAATDIFISGEDSSDIYVMSKPSKGVEQLIFVINKKNGSKKYIKVGENNKVALGGFVSEKSGSIYLSNFNDYKNGENTKIKSFADKCAASKEIVICGEDNSSFDSILDINLWNMGAVSFADEIKIFNKENREISSVPVSLISGEPLDVSSASYFEDLFIFKNKRNGALWSLNIR